MATAFSFPPAVPRRPASEPVAQLNWITNTYEFPAIEPEQLTLEFPPPPEETFDSEYVTLLATENGAQLFVSGFGLSLGKKSERVVVKHKGKACAEVPFLKLQEIVVGSRGVSLSTDLLDAACERGLRIAFLTGSGKPYALLTSPYLTATVETRKAQFAALDSEVGVTIARTLVAGKLRNQEKLLRYFSRTRDGERLAGLLKAAQAIRVLRKKALAVEGASTMAVRGTLMGLEGVAGRMYWEQWANILPDTLEFDGRKHLGPADGVNASLNYGYGILTSHVWGAVMNAGLEPFAGFLHTDRSGKPSLALDLVEEFRQPVVDRAIFGWLARGGRPRVEQGSGLLDGASREEVAARVLARLNNTEHHRGKSHQVRSIIQMQARTCAAAVRGFRTYRPFPFTW